MSNRFFKQLTQSITHSGSPPGMKSLIAFFAASTAALLTPSGWLHLITTRVTLLILPEGRHKERFWLPYFFDQTLQLFFFMFVLVWLLFEAMQFNKHSKSSCFASLLTFRPCCLQYYREEDLVKLMLISCMQWHNWKIIDCNIAINILYCYMH